MYERNIGREPESSKEDKLIYLNSEGKGSDIAGEEDGRLGQSECRPGIDISLIGKEVHRKWESRSTIG